MIDSHLGNINSTFVLPMDGYHLSLADLRGRDNAEELIYRRGAPDTFAYKKLKEDLIRLTRNNNEIINFPGFDHAQGDPVEDKHVYERQQIVIVEGLYLYRLEWDLLNIFDIKVFINANVDACIERLKIRNLCIPGYTGDEIRERCEKVDRNNALMVLDDRVNASDGFVVQSGVA